VLLTAFSTALLIVVIINWRLLASEGYIDPFTPIAAIVIAFWSSMISLAVGLPFYLWRRKIQRPDN
jgi:hypothetical protein